MLGAPGPIRGPAAEIDAKSPQAMAAFLFAVKNWQIGEFAEARGLFRTLHRDGNGGRVCVDE